MKKKKVPDFSRTFSAWWSQQDSNQRSRYASLARSGSQSASCFAAACMTCCSLRLRLAYSATGGASAPRPIDVNDVLSAPATFVQEEDEFPIRLQSLSNKGFHGICTRVQLHPPNRVRFFICTRVHDLCTLFAPGCRILLDILLQPIRHVGIVRFPGCFQGFISLPVVFIAIEEFLSMAFIFVNGAAFQPVLVPVVILFSVTFPLIRLINDHLSVTSRFSRM